MHDERIEIKSRHENKNSHVKTSYKLYNQTHPFNVEESEEEELYGPKVPVPKDSRLEFNAKGVSGKGKSLVTKHDADICGRRNASKLMNFPSNFACGDDTEYDAKLSNKVFNALKVHSKKSASHMARNRDKREERATTEQMDRKSRITLFKLINNGTLEEITGAISTGKEAVVFHAIGTGEDEDLSSGRLHVDGHCAIKVFKTTLSEFKAREQYICGSHRFKDKFSKQNPRKIIKLWAEQEFKNLKRLYRHSIRCPKPYFLKKHILVEEFIGEHGRPAPHLKNAVLSYPDLDDAYDQCKNILRDLFQKAELVHGDFSEYNLLWKNDLVWVIDVSQSVDITHQSAMKLLYHDCQTISTFFRRKHLNKLMSLKELIEFVTNRKYSFEEGDELLNEMELDNAARLPCTITEKNSLEYDLENGSINVNDDDFASSSSNED